MLSASDLASMRTCIADSFTHTAEIQENDLTVDGLGATDYWQTVTTCKCGLNPPHFPDIRHVGEEMRTNLDWEILLPFGTVVTRENRILVDGRVHLVTDVQTAAGGAEGTCVKVYAQREGV